MKLKAKKPNTKSIIGSYIKTNKHNILSVSRSNSPYTKTNLNRSDLAIKDDIDYLKNEIKKLNRKKIGLEITLKREVKKLLRH